MKEIESLKGKNSIKFIVNPLISKPYTPMRWESYNLKDIESRIKRN